MRSMFTSENFQNCNFYDILVVLIIYVRTISDMYACTRTDVDECASWGNGCPQECQNVKGSFKCQCHKGFFDTDNKGLECKAASEFSVHQSQLFWLSLTSPTPNSSSPLTQPARLAGHAKNSHFQSLLFATDMTCMAVWALRKTAIFVPFSLPLTRPAWLVGY